MTSSDEPNANLVCPRCGAERLTPVAPRCWLCKLDFAADPSPVAATWLPPAPKQRGASFSLASLMMFLTLVCVVLGLSTIAPGIAIPFGVVTLVAWLRTAGLARQRRTREGAITTSDKVQLFMESFGVSVVVVLLACVGACVAFFAACTVCFGTFAGLQEWMGEGRAIVVGYLVFGIVALILAIPMILVFVRTVRHWWQR